jgi:hypothetical protein
MDAKCFVDITVDEAISLADEYLFRLDSYWKPYLQEEIRQERVRLSTRRWFGFCKPINADATLDDAKASLEKKWDSLYSIWGGGYETERNAILDFIELAKKSTTGKVSMSDSLHVILTGKIKG